MLNDDKKLKAALQTYLEQSDGITVCMPSEVVHALLSRAGTDMVATPVDMVLFCPNCNYQHIDAEDEPEPASAGTSCPGLGVAVAEAYRAMLAAQAGQKLERVPSRTELELEVQAWREMFPKYQFNGILSIEKKCD